MKYYECDKCKKKCSDKLPNNWCRLKKDIYCDDVFHKGYLKVCNYYLCPTCADEVDKVIRGELSANLYGVMYDNAHTFINDMKINPNLAEVNNGGIMLCSETLKEKK